jgi:hypothetical protein
MRLQLVLVILFCGAGVVNGHTGWSIPVVLAVSLGMYLGQFLLASWFCWSVAPLFDGLDWLLRWLSLSPLPTMQGWNRLLKKCVDMGGK